MLVADVLPRQRVRGAFWFTEPSEMACVRSAGLTSSGCRICQVGEVSACPEPTAA
jgi:hypothetical protein